MEQLILPKCFLFDYPSSSLRKFAILDRIFLLMSLDKVAK
jgi:hypothetical protein